MWQLWRFRPRPFLQPWKWSRAYYAWRLETYSGIPMHEVTWRQVIDYFRQPHHRQALTRYRHWLSQMRRLRR